MSKPTHPTPPPWWAANSTAPYLTPAQVTRWTPRSALTLFSLLGLVAASLWVLLVATAPHRVTQEDNGILATQQSNDALIGGCGPLYSFPDPTLDSGTVPDKTAAGLANRLGYQTIVPIRGQFWDTPIADRTWRPTQPGKPVAEQILRNLWDGDMVAYYNHEVPDEDIDALIQFARNNPDLHLIVAPWEERLRGTLPRGRNLAFAAWNTTQTCHTLAVTALTDFREAAPIDAAPGADGTPPPVLRRTPPIGVTVN